MKPQHLLLATVAITLVIVAVGAYQVKQGHLVVLKTPLASVSIYPKVVA